MHLNDIASCQNANLAQGKFRGDRLSAHRRFVIVDLIDPFIIKGPDESFNVALLWLLFASGSWYVRRVI